MQTVVALDSQSGSFTRMFFKAQRWRKTTLYQVTLTFKNYSWPHLSLQLWDVEAQKRVRSMSGHSARVGCLSWNSYILSR